MGGISKNLIIMTCNFCGSVNYNPVHTLRDIRHKLPTEYQLVACENCGLLYLYPLPEKQELDAIYSQDYPCFIGAIEDSSSSISRWAQCYGLNRRCKAIIKRKKSGILLDVGCSTGYFLNQMRKYNDWQVVGIEPAVDAAQFAWDRYGLEIHTTDLIDTHFPSSHFDVVTLWDVLEHTQNPHEHLKEIFRVLKPDGLLVIKVPDPSSSEAKFFGQYWVGYDAPVHLFGFPPRVLTHQLKLVGYNDIQEIKIGSDYATFMTSFNLWLAGHHISKFSTTMQKLSQSHLARIIAFPLIMTLRYLGFGSSKTYFARKPE